MNNKDSWNFLLLFKPWKWRKTKAKRSTLSGSFRDQHRKSKIVDQDQNNEEENSGSVNNFINETNEQKESSAGQSKSANQAYDNKNQQNSPQSERSNNDHNTAIQAENPIPTSQSQPEVTQPISPDLSNIRMPTSFSVGSTMFDLQIQNSLKEVRTQSNNTVECLDMQSGGKFQPLEEVNRGSNLQLYNSNISKITEELRQRNLRWGLRLDAPVILSNATCAHVIPGYDTSDY